MSPMDGSSSEMKPGPKTRPMLSLAGDAPLVVEAPLRVSSVASSAPAMGQTFELEHEEFPPLKEVSSVGIAVDMSVVMDDLVIPMSQVGNSL